MLARRVIALSADKAFAKQLGTALKAAGGAVEIHSTAEALGRGELQAALVVVHAEGELEAAIGDLAARLPADGRLIAVLPKSDLVRALAIMQLSERIAGITVAEPWRSSDLSGMATRLLLGDIFGLEKMVPWGTRIYSQLVGDYQEKSLCIAQVAEFAETMGVRRKYREAVEQVVDEMLMNALYDAPVDDQGKQIFAEIPTKTRISVRMEQKVVVQYACDDKTFTVSVRDSYGTLDRETVVRYINKCLHSEQQIDRKTGGAGLGLYLMANSTSRMFFNVLPGVATECVCSFDLESPKIQLQKLGFFHERIDAAGRLAAGPSRLLPPGVGHPVERRSGVRAAVEPPRSPRGVIAALSTAIVLLLVLIGLVAYPRLDELRRFGISGESSRQHDVDTPPAPPRPATALVRIESDPPGARVTTAAGDDLGATPLETTSLEPGQRARIVLRKPGFADEPVDVAVPEPGGTASIARELSGAADIASIVVKSDPPGASVYLDGQRQLGAITPTGEILVESGKPHVVRLELEGHQPATVKVSPGPGAHEVPVTAKLTKALAITVTSNLEGKATIAKLNGCEKKSLPVTCYAPRGHYEVEIAPKAGGKITRKVDLKDKDVTVDVPLGVVEAPEDAKLLVNRREVERTALEVGKHLVTIMLADGTMVKSEVKVDPKRPVRVEIPE